MKCFHIKKLLSQYLDGGLGEKENELVSGHLKICSKCSKELDLLNETVSLLKAKESIEPPQDFVVQVRKKIESRRWWKEAIKLIFIPWKIKIPVEAIATILTACLLFYVCRDQMPPTPVTVMREKSAEIEEAEKVIKKEVAPKTEEIKGVADKTKAPVRAEIAVPRDERVLSALKYKELELKTRERREYDYSLVVAEGEAQAPLVKEELILTLKKPKKDLLRTKKYLDLLHAKDIEEGFDEIAGETIIDFQISRKDYLKLIRKLIQMEAIEPKEVKEIRSESVKVKLRIR